MRLVYLPIQKNVLLLQKIPIMWRQHKKYGWNYYF